MGCASRGSVGCVGGEGVGCGKDVGCVGGGVVSCGEGMGCIGGRAVGCGAVEEVGSVNREGGEGVG